MRLYDVEWKSVIMKNFAGRKERFNAEGNRYFCLNISEELAEEMESINVKVLRNKLIPYIPVYISIKRHPDFKGIIINGKEFPETRWQELDEATSFEVERIIVSPFITTRLPLYTRLYLDELRLRKEY